VKLETLTSPLASRSRVHDTFADCRRNCGQRYSPLSISPLWTVSRFYWTQVTNPGHQRTTSLSEKSGSQQTTAEKDMEIIRSKRASSTGGSIVGQQKTKYRKRSVSSLSSCLIDLPSQGYPPQRASPPGKCHSCNIRETPEWRRGPDGARTLCNACGLREFIISSRL
jgi:hypothetical protein